eukprot:6174629-Pleurochrysis_carterae.AAC.2
MVRVGVYVCVSATARCCVGQQTWARAGEPARAAASVRAYTSEGDRVWKRLNASARACVRVRRHACACAPWRGRAARAHARTRECVYNAVGM